MAGMTRKHLFGLIGIGDVVVPTIEKAYNDKLTKEWEGGLGDDPHGYKWHTRLHASSAPGSNASCKRKSLYGFLDLPKEAPEGMRLIRYAEVGLDAEARLVDIWDKYGILLSAHTDDEHQTNLKEPELWFSGNMDAAILPEGKNSPHIVEIKSRALEKVQAMKTGKEPVDHKHENQLRSYVAMANEQKLFMDDPRVESPCTSGSVLYVARDNPNVFHEFVFQHDPEWWEKTVERIKEIQTAFIEERNDLDIPRNEDGSKVGWSKGECCYCELKKWCKKDFTEEVFDLRESHLVKKAKEDNPNYDYDKARKRVLDAWN